MATADRYLRVVGIGGTLREGSITLVGLAQKVGTKQSSRRAEPVGAVA